MGGGGEGGRGVLEAMGVGPTTPVSVAGLAGGPLPAGVEHTAEKLADRALAQRPDLMARVAPLRAREADIRKAESEFRPRIVVAGDLGQNIGRVRADGPWSSVNQPAYGAAISIELPLFDGGLRRDRLPPPPAPPPLRLADGRPSLPAPGAGREGQHSRRHMLPPLL